MTGTKALWPCCSCRLTLQAMLPRRRVPEHRGIVLDGRGHCYRRAVTLISGKDSCGSQET